jgi:hypothetical protein
VGNWGLEMIIEFLAKIWLEKDFKGGKMLVLEFTGV